MKREHTLPQNKYKDSPVVIYWKHFKNQDPQPGLYTADTKKWIKWLSKKDYDIAREIGVYDAGFLTDVKEIAGNNPEYKQSKLDQLKQLSELRHGS